ncbi:MAG TPA: PAS domain S-box protein [Polyangia bacterium]|jgi:PAS domain S-box-containing protein|nr:PAS domain S-box protein [Polyangia bacterium]
MGKTQRVVLNYGAAILAVVLAVWIRYLLTPWLGTRLPFITLFGAVGVAVWVGGVPPAIVATVIGYLGISYLILEPRYIPVLRNAGDVVGLVTYILSSALVIGFGASMRAAQRRAEEHAREALTERLRSESAVAERERQEHELREAHRRTAAILEHLTDGFFTLDREWRFTYVNGQALRSFGLTKDQAMGQILWEVLPSLKGSEFEQQYKKAMAHGEPVHFDTYWAWMGRWIETHGYPSGDGLTVFFRDITERKQAAEALRRSEEKYRGIIEMAQEGIWMIDTQTNIALVNRRLAELLGYQPEEMLGRYFYDFLYDEDRIRAQELFERRRAGVKEQVDFRFRHKNGQEVWTILASQPILDSGGRFGGMLEMFTDVTERKRVDTAQRETDRHRAEFLLSLAKELRHPLVLIADDLRSLRQVGGDAGKSEQARAAAEAHLQQLVQLVDKLLGGTA